jgi:hypothetical protein
MNKVDVMTASSYTGTHRGSATGKAVRAGATRASYCREPYVRVTMDGKDVDAKAISWDRTSVQVKWIDTDGTLRTAWVAGGTVSRIHRDESSWRDPYDDYAFYYPGS